MKTTNNKLMSDVMQVNLGLLPLIMDNIPQAVFWKDRNLVYLGCNQAFADDAGFPSPEDVIGKTDFDMPWKAQAEFYRADDLRVIETNESKLHYEEPQSTPDGSTIWLSTSKIPVHENGQVVAVLGMYEDVTAHRQAEDTIHESEERFRRFAEATVDGLVFHEQGTIIDANPASLAMLGLSDKSEFIGRNLLEFIAPEFHKVILQNMQLDVTHSHEIGCIRKDGTIFPVENITRTYKVGDRTIRASSIRDITERKEAVRAIQENELRFRALFENANDAIFTLREDMIIDLNSKTLEMFKLESKDQVIGHSVGEFSPEFQPDGASSAQKAGEKINLALQGEPQFFEWKHIHGDGTSFDAEISLNRLEIGGETLVQAIVRDITERKQTESELQREKIFSDAVINGLAGMFFLFDTQGKLVRWNEEYEKVLGYTTSELAAITAMDPIADEDKEKTAAAIGRAFTEGQGSIESVAVTKDGRQIPFHFAARRIQQGGQLYMAGTGLDITERKQLETQIQKALEKRGYQVQVSTDISQEVAAATELSELFERVVTLTKERLGYYHTQLLRYDPAQVAVVLINGYGETGQKMLDAGHRMPMGSGLIGTAASTGKTVMRSTLEEDPDWKPNPHLPETKGEIAVPIKWQNNVLGVLDVQSNQAGALVEDDRLLLEGLCGQIAIAMHSAELVEIVRQNEARLAEALKVARLAHWEYDVEKDIFTFNDQFYSIFRTTVERVGGYKISSADYSKNFVHPDDASLVGSEIQKALDAKDHLFTTQLEHRIVFSDGEVGHIAVNINVERDENGKITRWYGANQDITERKLAEARLAEALKVARLAHWEYDVEKDLFIFNDQFYSIFHTTAEKVGGYQLSSTRYSELFVHPDDLPMVGTGIGKALSSTEKVYKTTLHHRILYADGGIGYLTVKLTVERDENGKITRYYGANQDVTESKLAEARLAEALRAARLANWEYDVEKDLFTFNDEFYSIFHTTVEKAGGYQLSSARYAELFVHPDDRENVGAEIGKALSSTEKVYNISFDHRILYADGGIGYLTVKLTVERDENGKITRSYGANQDITERKQSELALRKSEQEMAERLEELNRLYRNMSHEGWKTYRETAVLPAGFMFDQTGTRPLEEVALADENLASVPMKVLGGEVVGTLAVASDPRNPTSAEDIAFIQRVSDQIALALEGARLTAQTQSALAQSERLFQASRILTQSANLQELVAAVVTTLNIPAMNRALLTIFEYGPSGGIEQLTIIANWWNGSGHEVTPNGKRYPREMMPVMSMFVSPVPVFFDDTLNDERVDATTLEMIVKKLNLRSIAVLPLFSTNKQIGALVLEGEETHHFTQQEIRLFSSLAPQIATVVENRLQFEQAQQQAEREAMLNAISQKIQSATSVEAVLQIAARELGRAFDASKAVAQLSAVKKNGGNGNNGNGHQ